MAAAWAGTPLAGQVVSSSAATAGTAGRTHVVRPGESLWSIAQEELGDGSRWEEIYRSNRGRIGPVPRRIRPGIKLVLRSGAGRSEQAAAHYRVKPGDSLWRIADRRLGNGERWRRIYKFNRKVIGDNPARLHPGMVLALRGRDEVAEIRRPRRVAKVPAAKPVTRPVAKAPVARPVTKPEAKAPVAKPVAKPQAKAPVPKPVTKPEAKAPVARPVTRPQAKAPVARPVTKPEAKAPVAKPVTEPEAKAPVVKPVTRPDVKAGAPRNPFEFRGGQAGASRPDTLGTPPGRNPFAFDGDNAAPGARTVQGQAQRRVGGMPVVPSYPDESAQATRKGKAQAVRKGKAPVAVDVKGGRAVAKKKGRRHMASSPGPKDRKQ